MAWGGVRWKRYTRLTVEGIVQTACENVKECCKGMHALTFHNEPLLLM